MAETSYTPQEAAVVSGAPLAVIQKAITTGRVPAHVAGKGNRRQLDETGVLAFALAEALPRELHISAGDAYSLLRGSGCESAQALSGEMLVGELVRIDTGRALGDVLRRLRLYRRARELVVRDPAVMGGTPVIAGTRITAQSIQGRLAAGDSVESVLEDYPYLDCEAVEAVALWAAANPMRGRPRGRLWRHAS